MENSVLEGLMETKYVLPQFCRDTSVDKPDEKDVMVDHRENQGDVERKRQWGSGQHRIRSNERSNDDNIFFRVSGTSGTSQEKGARPVPP